ncbi:MAG: 50S ribosomal protein L13 [bacterium]|nr:50S ribosomal protein L13 [bacterium]
MNSYTLPTKGSEVSSKWHEINAEGMVLGRLASVVAQLLIGKAKPNFTRNLLMGDYVVIINSSKIVVTGDKSEQKLYDNYSGYPGGLKQEKYKDLNKRKPGEVIRIAVSGMLPKNKLRKEMLRKLFIFSDAEHKYKDKIEVIN